MSGSKQSSLAQVGSVTFVARFAGYLVFSSSVAALLAICGGVRQWLRSERGERWILRASHPRVEHALLVAFHLLYLRLLIRTVRRLSPPSHLCPSVCLRPRDSFPLLSFPLIFVTRCHRRNCLTAARWVLRAHCSSSPPRPVTPVPMRQPRRWVGYWWCFSSSAAPCGFSWCCAAHGTPALAPSSSFAKSARVPCSHLPAVPARPQQQLLLRLRWSQQQRLPSPREQPLPRRH